VILVTRLNGTQYYVNAELIQTVEATPDTIISLTNNAKLVVKEKPEIIIERVIEYQNRVRIGKYAG
jgi:flagellar protein FlbD